MLNIQSNYPLKNNNTFNVDIACDWYTEPESADEIEFAVQYAKDRSLPFVLIGEGSNLLFTEVFKGIIIHPNVKGIEVLNETASEISVSAGAGVNWDAFVEECVQNEWYGAENLSYIPGSVGAAPVQNIGAYGVEAKDLIEYVEVFDSREMKLLTFANAECEFGYRDSVFKRESEERYIVTRVVFRLQKKGELNLNYGNVKEEFLKNPLQNIQGLRETIISIRQNKLPDPAEFGNAGSFFKNPIITNQLFEKILAENSTAPGYPSGIENTKIPAAWLIEQAGWKGVREGNVGTWPKQALVIVNYGNASGEEILNFSEKIRTSVLNKFGVNMEREVTLL